MPLLLDTFTHSGPYGSHSCLIFELLGSSLSSVITDYDETNNRLDPENILRISRQLLQAVAAVHEAGFCHGDISVANIVFTVTAEKSLTGLSEEELFNGITGVPRKAKLISPDGGQPFSSNPKQIVKQATWAYWIDEDEDDIRLLDWAEAFAHGAEPKWLAQPYDLRAPEILFTDHFDYRVHLWRTGCVIYSLVFLRNPFSFIFCDSNLIAQMDNFMEPLPTEWQEKWQEIKDRDGKRDQIEPSDTGETWLDRNFREKKINPKLECILPIIRGLIRLRPSERLSAADALALLEDAIASFEPDEDDE